jgi:hypothetical protein
VADIDIPIELATARLLGNKLRYVAVRIAGMPAGQRHEAFAAAERWLRQIASYHMSHKEAPHVHHDALQFPDGEVVLLNDLNEGRQASAPAMTEGEAAIDDERIDRFVNNAMNLLRQRVTEIDLGGDPRGGA